MPNGARETKHSEHSEHWELTSAETAERIVGHSKPGSGLQCCLHYIQMFSCSRQIEKNTLYIKNVCMILCVSITRDSLQRKGQWIETLMEAHISSCPLYSDRERRQAMM